MNKELKKFVAFCSLFLLDLFSFYISLFLAVNFRYLVDLLFPQRFPKNIFSFNYYFSIWWLPLIFVVFFSFEKLYFKKQPFWEEEKFILKSVFQSIVFIFFVITITEDYGSVSRLTIFFLGLIFFPIVSVIRFWGKRILNILGIWSENVLIIGINEKARRIAESYIKEKEVGYSIVGFLTDDGVNKKRIKILNREVEILGSVKNFKSIIKNLNVDNVIIALENYTQEEILKLSKEIQRIAKTVMIKPLISDIAQLNTEIHYLFFEKTLLIKINNNLKSLTNQIIKAVLDILIVLVLSPFLLLFICIIAIAVKLTSKGPVFIKQERMGKGGKIFNCLKFRTMYENGDKILEEYLSKNSLAKKEWDDYRKLKTYDPRVTQIGKFLRKTSLDELPQFINVLRGEMSVVGPRPYLIKEKRQIKEFLNIILLAKPGITGLWQVSGRNDLKFLERAELEAWYVENWSVWLDFIILIRTIFVIFKGNGAY
ncbi:MAG: sugar transferase [Brevinematia bacterium]